MPKEEQWRLFIAIPVPQEAKRLAIDSFRVPHSIQTAIRWVSIDNMHITLAFIGDLDVGRIPELTHSLDKTIHKRPAISLQIDRYGAFPNPKHARVVWAGPSLETPELTAVSKEVITALKARHIPFDSKEFHPHLTLGRSKGMSLRDDLTPYMDGVLIEHAPVFIVNSLHLFRSELSQRGAEYTIVHTVSFGEP